MARVPDLESLARSKDHPHTKPFQGPPSLPPTLIDATCADVSVDGVASLQNANATAGPAMAPRHGLALPTAPSPGPSKGPNRSAFSQRSAFLVSVYRA